LAIDLPMRGGCFGVVLGQAGMTVTRRCRVGHRRSARRALGACRGGIATVGAGDGGLAFGGGAGANARRVLNAFYLGER